MKFFREVLLVVLAVAAAILPVAAVLAAGEAEREDRVDPAEGSLLDIVGASIEQREHSVSLETRFHLRAAEAFGAAGDGSTVCFTFVRQRERREICAERTRGKLIATRDGKRIAATVKTSANLLVVRASDAKFKLSTGAYDLSVRSNAASCDNATTADRCADRAPDNGAYNVRVWRVVQTGCKVRGTLEVRHGRRVKQVALTFDDGPSRYTGDVLRTLDRRNVHATFFILGQQVSSGKSALRKMMRDGHEPANHGWSHGLMGGGGPAATRELKATQKAVRGVTGYTTCVFRPPYGDTGPDLRRRVRALGMTTIIWDVDPLDWRTPGTGAIVGRVVSGTRRGSIILLHDGGGNRSQTAGAIDGIVTRLRRRGFEFVTVSELLRYEPVTKLER